MPTAVALVGATASGKSELVLAAAQAVPGTEVVALDAMQVYRGMDIGTAKPTAAEQARVRHHCLDLVEPTAEWTVADHQHAVRTALDDIRARGGRPLLVAGTGLYLRAVIDDLRLPGEWPEARARLEAEADLARLYTRLQQLDPVAAARTLPTNRRRVVRALEVCEGSGRPFSSFGPGLDSYPPVDVVQIGLRWPRERLAERVRARLAAMLDAGFLDEVAALATRPLSRTARQALGYRELLDHLAGRVTLDDAVATIEVRTRRFATRQDRWFRRDPRIRWIDIETDVHAAEPALVDALTS